MTVAEQPFKDFFHLVRFRYGDPSSPTEVRYTDNTADVSNGAAGGVFSSLPSLKITGIQNTGVLADKPVYISMESTIALALQVSAMEPHSPVFVKVWQVNSTPDVPVPDLDVLYIGRMTNAVRDPDGVKGTVRIEFKSWKARLNTPFGVPALPHCTNGFGDADCSVDVDALEDDGTMTGVVGKKVFISGLGAQTGKYWHRGSVRRNGLRIMIRDWDATASTQFYLSQEPPAEWEGEAVTVRPGCDRSPATCEDRWSNLDHFNGRGYATPNRNPAFRSS